MIRVVMIGRVAAAVVFSTAVVVAAAAVALLVREAVAPHSPTRALLRYHRDAKGLEPRNRVQLHRALVSAYQRDCALALLAAAAGLTAVTVILSGLR